MMGIVCADWFMTVGLTWRYLNQMFFIKTRIPLAHPFQVTMSYDRRSLYALTFNGARAEHSLPG
jgi:hypothetical protein